MLPYKLSLSLSFPHQHCISLFLSFLYLCHLKPLSLSFPLTTNLKPLFLCLHFLSHSLSLFLFFSFFSNIHTISLFLFISPLPLQPIFLFLSLSLLLLKIFFLSFLFKASLLLNYNPYFFPYHNYLLYNLFLYLSLSFLLTIFISVFLSPKSINECLVNHIFWLTLKLRPLNVLTQ